MPGETSRTSVETKEQDNGAMPHVCAPEDGGRLQRFIERTPDIEKRWPYRIPASVALQTRWTAARILTILQLAHLQETTEDEP